MASGKQSKRRRREVQASTPPRPVRRKGESRRASPKVLIGAVVLISAIGLAAGLGIALTGGSSSSSSVPERGSLTGALPGAGQIDQLFHGIHQAGHVLGSPQAPVTMIEYVDLQCPYCRAFETEAMPDLVSRYVRTGKVKIEARLLAFIGPDSERGRLAAIAAGQQGKLFNLTELLYFNQGAENTGWLSHDLVAAAAASIPGVAVPRLLATSESSSVKEQAANFDSLAKTGNVSSTPTILVGKSGQKPRRVTLASPTDGQAVATAIEKALR